MRDALLSFSSSWKSDTDGFVKKTENFGVDIDKIARNYGLRCLPDELLVDILDRAAGSFKSSVKLSHVCKRFRHTLVSSSKRWNGQTLTSRMSPWIISTLIERYGDGPFKGEIDLKNEAGRSSDTVKAVLDIGARLDQLTIEDRISPSPLSLPGYTLVPSPRHPECSFLPHPSLSKNLVVCSLFLRTVSLEHLLDFLSSADKLETLLLSFYGAFSDHDNCGSLKSISLPSLTTLRLDPDEANNFEAIRQFMEKIVPFTATSLDVYYSSDVGIGSVVDLIHAKPSIRDLRLDVRRPYHSVPSIPLHIETLELSKQHVRGTINAWLRNPELFPARNLRLLKISDCQDLDLADVLHLRDLFVDVGCNQVRFQFKHCAGMEIGIYELADVDKAILG